MNIFKITICFKSLCLTHLILRHCFTKYILIFFEAPLDIPPSIGNKIIHTPLFVYCVWMTLWNRANCLQDLKGYFRKVNEAVYFKSRLKYAYLIYLTSSDYTRLMVSFFYIIVFVFISSSINLTFHCLSLNCGWCVFIAHW